MQQINAKKSYIKKYLSREALIFFIFLYKYKIKNFYVSKILPILTF